MCVCEKGATVGENTCALSITVLRVPRVACPPVMFTCTNTGQVRHGESACVRTSSGTRPRTMLVDKALVVATMKSPRCEDPTTALIVDYCRQQNGSRKGPTGRWLLLCGLPLHREEHPSPP